MFQEHDANIGRSPSTFCRNYVEGLWRDCHRQWKLRTSKGARRALPDLLNNIRCYRRSFPCSCAIDSLLCRIEFPVIFVGNFRENARQCAAFGRTFVGNMGPKIDNFPVNSLITGNFCQRHVGSGLRGAPFQSYDSISCGLIHSGTAFLQSTTNSHAE